MPVHTGGRFSCSNIVFYFISVIIHVSGIYKVHFRNYTPVGLSRAANRSLEECASSRVAVQLLWTISSISSSFPPHCALY